MLQWSADAAGQLKSYKSAVLFLEDILDFCKQMSESARPLFFLLCSDVITKFKPVKSSSLLSNGEFHLLVCRCNFRTESGGRKSLKNSIKQLVCEVDPSG